MKTKLFIAMLLIPLMFGCNKESNTIVGDWYLCSTEYSDSSDPEAYHSTEYTKENTIGIISYTADGKVFSKFLYVGTFKESDVFTSFGNIKEK